MRKKSTTINEVAREVLHITRDEYAFCLYIQYRQITELETPGWASPSQAELSDFIGMSRAAIWRMRQRLVEKGLIVIEEESGQPTRIRVSAIWIQEMIDKGEIDAYWVAKNEQCFLDFHVMRTEAANRKQREPKKGFVYLIKDCFRDIYKIGFATNVDSRFSQLKTANAGIELVKHYPATMEHESALHELFSCLNITGEWFALETAHIAEIDMFFKNETFA